MHWPTSERHLTCGQAPAFAWLVQHVLVYHDQHWWCTAICIWQHTLQCRLASAGAQSDGRVCNAHAEFQPENWRTKSAKFGKSAGNATLTGAKSAKNMTVSGAKSLKEKDWTKEKGAAARGGTAVKNGGVSAFGAMKRGIGNLVTKAKGGAKE